MSDAALPIALQALGLGAGASAGVDAVARSFAKSLSGDTAIQATFELIDLGAAVSWPAGDGVVWSADFDAGRYTLGLSRISADLLDFTRSGKGAARGDGEQVVFAKNAPRIHNGRLWLDAGGTNPMTAPTDITNAAWTKTGLDGASATSVAGEAGATAAKRVPETNTGSAQLHQVVNVTTIPSSTTVTFCAIVDADGRDYLDLDLWNGSTTAGVRLRCNVTTGTISSSYPALIGSGASAPKGGIWSLSGGRVLVWCSCVFPAAVTSIRPTIKLLSDATTASYIGDTSKALVVEAVWVLPGVASPTSFIETSRSAEALSVALPAGYYKEITADEAGTNVSLLSVASATAHSVAPGSDHFTLSSARIYNIPLLDDFSRSDTADGAPIGAAPTGQTAEMLTYDGAWPMVPATHGHISSGALTITPASVQSERTFYAVYDAHDIGADSWKSVTMECSWGSAHAGSGALSNTSITIGFSSDPVNPDSVDRLIYHLPVHAVMTRSALSVQYRDNGEASPFPIIGVNTFAFAPNRAIHTVSIDLDGDIILAMVDNYPAFVVNNAILATECRYMFVEITSDSDNTTDTGFIERVYGAGYKMTDVPAFVAAAPVITKVAFVSPSSPASYTAGALLSVLPDPVHYISNTGTVTFAYQWRKNGVNIGGATSSTYQTTDGVDEGGVYDCIVSVTNSAGTINSASTPTSALA